MKSLVIGKGEVGIAMFQVLNPIYPTEIKDKENLEGKFEILHICFPYSEIFEREVRQYQRIYKPIFTVIHSTIPIGVSRRCQAYHSPIRGVHPQLIEGIKTFVKYLAPPNQRLKEYFEKAGIRIKMLENPETTEAGKLFSTTYYGLCIAYHAYVNRICKEKGLDFKKVMDEFNRTYNEGYLELDMENVRRPILYPPRDGKIGGHCIIPNAEILKKQFGIDPILEAILRHKNV